MYDSRLFSCPLIIGSDSLEGQLVKSRVPEIAILVTHVFTCVHSFLFFKAMKYIQDLQNKKNVKRGRDGIAKMYANKAGIMHESKGKHIGKPPSLHLFHTIVRWCMWVFLKLAINWQPLMAVHGCSVIRLLPTPMWPGNKASMTHSVALCYMEPLQ